MSTQQYYSLPKPEARNGFDSLELKSGPIPKPGAGQVLVQVKAVSLNFRDLIIALDKYPLFLHQGNLIPCSDGAGVVKEVGEGVTKWKPDDKVASNFSADHLKGAVPTKEEAQTGLGGGVDGMLAEYRVLPASSLVRIPSHLSFEEAATLPCAALTAWNALYGLIAVKSGETVVAEGTGGVSVFAAQFAVAAGARCVLTSSSDDKLAKVRAAIPQHLHHLLTTVNYKTNPVWEKEVMRVSDGIGASHIIEVGGAGTLPKAFACIKPGGVLTDIGFVASGDMPNVPGLVLGTSSIYRGILVGPREMFEDMNRSISSHQLKPVVDKVFDFKDAKKAYEHQWSGSHVGKVVIRVGA